MIRRSTLVRSCVSGCAVLLVGLVLVAIAGRLTLDRWMPMIARGLEVSADVQPADVIVSLGGGDGDREVYASTLYRAGMAKNLIVTGGPTTNPALTDELVQLGVARDAITIASGSLNTLDDAQKTRRIVQQHGWRSMLLVSDPYHMRRSVWVFDDTFAGSGVTIHPAPVVGGSYSADHWWQDPDSFVTVFDEYLKLAYYLEHGYIHPLS